MNSEAPQAPRTDLVPITEDFDDGPEEVTGIRKIVRNTFDHSDYPARPDRVVYLDRCPTKHLEHELEAQIDQWGMQRMLKTQVVLIPGDEQRSIAENVLQECRRKKKIHDFESTVKDGKLSYTLYYRYNR